MVPKRKIDCVRLEFSGSKVISILGLTPIINQDPDPYRWKALGSGKPTIFLKKHEKNNAFLQRLQAKKLKFFYACKL